MTCRWALPISVLLALLALAGPSPARAAPVASGPARSTAKDASEVEAARAELASLALEIEALKKEVVAGRAGRTQLQPLLARAQELAARIEQLQPPHAAPPAAAAVPDAQELRERADALRDRADRLDRTLPPLEARILELRRRARLEQSLQTVGGAGDVLADSAPRAAPSNRTGGAAATASPEGPATTSAGGASGSGLPAGFPSTGTPAPSTATSSPTTQPTITTSTMPAADAAARALSVPPGRDADPLLPAAGDSLQDLLRKRARVRGETSALRTQAEALEIEAARTETVR